MENNILPLFLKTPGDVSAQGTPVSQPHVDLEALKGAFSDLLHRTGDGLETGLTIISDHTGRAINTHEAESEPADEPISDNHTQASDRNNESGRSNDDDSYRDAPRADRRDDNRDHDSSRQADNNTETVRGDGDTEVAHRSDERPQDQNQSSNNNNDSEQSATDSNGAGSDRQNSDQGQNTAQNGKDDGTTSNSEFNAAADESSATPIHSGGFNTDTILGELLAAAETNFAAGTGIEGAAGQVNGAAEANFAAGTGVEGAAGQVNGAAKAESALQGLAKAIASLGNNGVQQQSSQANTQNQSPELQALAKAIAGAQGDAKAITENGPANNSSTLQQQAAVLSQKIGEGNRAQVNVNVTKEAEVLISQTSSSLSPNAALAGDAQGLPLRAQQALNAANNPGSQVAGLNNAAQNQQAANQSAQQAVNSIGAEAKIAAPIAQTASGQGASSGGGESSSATSSQTSAQEARETQQSSQTQSSNTNRTNGQRQAVMDQISVNITRAVNAGLDRINIQLQPESLGKVDVSLELAKDGKITAVIQAENKETLELLSRDAKELTKALQNAGLQLDEGDIAFNLSGQSDEAGDGSLADGSSAADGDEKVSTDAELAELNNIEDDDVIEDDRVNIRV
jgi:flagellar hook-length control protein FliK